MSCEFHREIEIEYVVCGYCGPEGTFKKLREAQALKRQLHKDYGVGWIVRNMNDTTTITVSTCIEGNPQ